MMETCPCKGNAKVKQSNLVWCRKAALLLVKQALELAKINTGDQTPITQQSSHHQIMDMEKQ